MMGKTDAELSNDLLADVRKGTALVTLQMLLTLLKMFSEDEGRNAFLTSLIRFQRVADLEADKLDALFPAYQTEDGKNNAVAIVKKLMLHATTRHALPGVYTCTYDADLPPGWGPVRKQQDVPAAYSVTGSYGVEDLRKQSPTYTSQFGGSMTAVNIFAPRVATDQGSDAE